jgi:DNA-binding response OmpR family regulator
MARVKAILRRAHPMLDANEIIDLPLLKINLKEYKVMCQNQDMVLPPKEMEMLYFLALHPNQVFTRQQLLEQIWGLDFEGDPRTVDVHIKRVREKLGDSNPYWVVKTIRGVGYKFEVNN